MYGWGMETTTTKGANMKIKKIITASDGTTLVTTRNSRFVLCHIADAVVFTDPDMAKYSKPRKIVIIKGSDNLDVIRKAAQGRKYDPTRFIFDLNNDVQVAS